MAGMYPDNKDLELFGETVSWPGVDKDGKFTNGDFRDPLGKPSFIPAETVNLILDNLEKLIIALGKTPNNKDADQVATVIVDALAKEEIERIVADNTLANEKAPLDSPTFTGTPKAPTAAAKNNSTQVATTAYVDRAKLESWPVGAIYRSVDSTSPATLLGGTWTVWGSGRTLVGVDSAQTEFNTVEKTGGSKTHTLSETEMPSHTHAQNSHNHTQNSHNHSQNSHNHGIAGASNNPWATGTIQLTSVGSQTDELFAQTKVILNNQKTMAVREGFLASTTPTNQPETATNQAQTATNQNAGGGGSHNNLQPYITCYVWKRTA
jgi:microcystin-dependent protein